VEAGGAKVVTDRIQASATMGEFAAAIEPLLTRPEARSAMVKALRGLGPADGAARVARAVLDLARR
jgi:UDP-N-acetylglucosamine:LPS N-acetylglucosamine transferase